MTLCYKYDMPIELCEIICDYARPRGFCKSPMGQAMTKIFDKTKEEWVNIKAIGEAEDEKALCLAQDVTISREDYNLCKTNFEKRFNKMSLYDLILWGSIPQNRIFKIWIFHLGLLDDMRENYQY